MNVAATFLNQHVYHDVTNSTKLITNEKSIFTTTFFQHLFDQTDSYDAVKAELHEQLVNFSSESLSNLYNMLVSSDELSDELITNMLEQNEIDSLVIQKLIRDPEGLELLVDHLSKIMSNQDEEELEEQNLIDYVQSLRHANEIVNRNESNMNEETINYELDQLITQIKSLLEDFSIVQGELELDFTVNQQIAKIAPQVLKLLEKWTTISHDNHSTNSYRSNVPIQDDSKVDILLKQLLHSYQKRTQLFTKQQYHAESQVTSKDIEKWLQNALASQVELGESSQIKQVNVGNMPVSNIEHYIIHMHQNIHSKPVETQLLEQFQQVMQSSRFLTNSNGMNQLSISLQPENLGEMLVRFTEVNGEMILKILVSSQATRQMLESNIHELRNMFSPHQISIEEQEFDIQQTQRFDEEFHEQQQEQSQHSNQEEQESSSTDHGDSFQQLLNEKV